MFPVNAVLRWKDAVYRLIHRDADRLWLFPIESRSPSCIAVGIGDFGREMNAGTVAEIPDPFTALKLRKMTDAENRRGEENLALIQPLIEDGVRAFESGCLKKLISRLSAEFSGNERLAYQRKLKRTLVLWWQRGQVPAVLMPDWAPKTNVRAYSVKPGRKSPQTENAPALNDEIRKAFDKVCRERLMVPGHDSVKEAYTRFLHDWMKTRKVTESQSPTLYQFRNYYYKTYPKAERTRDQATEDRFEKDLRPLTGSTYDIARGPGHIYEIDATMDNVQLLNDSRTEVVGRPYLYLVTDVFTGVIVGFDISFEAPQLKTAGDALFNAMTDKVAYCARYDITIPRKWWPAQGVPATVTADNAELTSDQALHLNRAYGVSVNFTKTRRADQKGTVESSIGMVQKSLRGLIRHRGLVLKDGALLRKAGDMDSRGDAVLTLDDYRLLVIRAILIINRRRRNNVPPGLPASIPARCLDIWHHYESRGHSMLRRENDPNLLRLSLLKHYNLTCSAKGMCVEGIRYLPEDPDYLRYFTRGSSPQYSDKWQIVLDPSDITHAWLQPDEKLKPTKYVQCSLAPASAHLAGMTLRAAREYIREAALTESRILPEEMAFSGKQKAEQEEIIRNAERQKPQDERSVRQKVKGIKTKRSEEIELRESSAPRVTPEQKEKTPKADAQSKAPEADAQSKAPEADAQAEAPESRSGSMSRTGGGSMASNAPAGHKPVKPPREQSQPQRSKGLGLDMHFDGGNIDMNLI